MIQTLGIWIVKHWVTYFSRNKTLPFQIETLFKHLPQLRFYSVAVILQSTPADAGWGSCISMWKTEYGIATVSDVPLVYKLKSRQAYWVILSISDLTLKTHKRSKFTHKISYCKSHYYSWSPITIQEEFLYFTWPNGKFTNLNFSAYS